MQSQHQVIVALIMLDLVSSVLCQEMAGRNVSKMTYLCVELDIKPQLNRSPAVTNVGLLF